MTVVAPADLLRLTASSLGALVPDFSLENPYVIVGLLFGGLLPYLFGGMFSSSLKTACGTYLSAARARDGESGIVLERRVRRLRRRGRSRRCVGRR